MKPAINDFELCNYTDINNLPKSAYYRECWTDSKCVFINRDKLQEFLEKLGKKIGKKFEYDIINQYNIISKIKK